MLATILRLCGTLDEACRSAFACVLNCAYLIVHRVLGKDAGRLRIWTSRKLRSGYSPAWPIGRARWCVQSRCAYLAYVGLPKPRGRIAAGGGASMGSGQGNAEVGLGTGSCKTFAAGVERNRRARPVRNVTKALYPRTPMHKPSG